MHTNLTEKDGILFQNSSEYLFWEVLAVVAGVLGPAGAAVHTVNASIQFLTFPVGVGFMVAICTRIGNVLAVSVSRARSICLWGSLFSYSVFVVSNVLVYLLGTPITKLFTSDPEVIDGCDTTRLDLLLFVLVIN
jgi:Na+-driven multidrug efflux pump